MAEPFHSIVHFLLLLQMISEKAKEDVETLLNMEMKLLLLDVEDVPIPEVPPQVPEEPEDLNYFYKND